MRLCARYSRLNGAYGAALYAQERRKLHPQDSALLKAEQLRTFSHTVKSVTCGLCSNHCHLTVNIFADGKPYISGNRCERPVTHCAPNDSLNLYRYKLQLLEEFKPVPGRRGKIGLPLGLNMYELLPFWHTFFTELGFEVITSPIYDKTFSRKARTPFRATRYVTPLK